MKHIKRSLTLAVTIGLLFLTTIPAQASQFMFGTQPYEWKGVDVFAQHGRTFDDTAISAAVAANSGVTTTLWLQPGTWNIASGTTIPKNFTLGIATGTILSIDSGVTLIVPSPGHVNVNHRQQFISGLGAISYTGSGTVYPQQWGAVADGITDDSVEIQASIKSLLVGGEVVFLDGTYLTSVRILVAVNDITINIRPGATISLAAASDVNIFASVGYDRITYMGGGTLDGNRASQTDVTACDGGHFQGNGIYAENSNDLTIKNLNITDMAYRGIRLLGASYRTIIDRNNITDCGCDGIYAGDTSGTTMQITRNFIDGCVIDAADRGNILVSDSAHNNILISENTLSNAFGNSSGLFVGGSARQVRVLNNNACNNGHNGLEVNSVGSIVTGNHCSGNGLSGVTAAGIYISSQSVVSNNICVDNFSHGIRGVSSSNFVISGNVCMNNDRGAGLRLATTPSSGVVIGNMLTDNQGSPTQDSCTDITTPDGLIFIGNLASGNTTNVISNKTYNSRFVGNIESGTSLLGQSDYVSPTAKAVNLTGNATFIAGTFDTYIIDPSGATRTFNPSGSFLHGQAITVINVADAAETITFDSAGLNQDILQNKRARFIYESGGDEWLLEWLY